MVSRNYFLNVMLTDTFYLIPSLKYFHEAQVFVLTDCGYSWVVTLDFSLLHVLIL
uniref:Uncharacterized protein n=1 Tax=Octopus bimaculoides TaxID=37653 RepID=A0A0L8H1M4_OCTBM